MLWTQDYRLIFTLHPEILIWFPGDIDIGIQASLIQIYPILLSTLLSINRQTLSLYDANYALLITSSPPTVYLAVASICDIFWFETDLHKPVKSHRRTTRILGALVLFLWLGLCMTLTLSDRAFVNSEDCRGSSPRIGCGMFPGAFRTHILEVNLRDLVFSCIRIDFRALSIQEVVSGDGGFSSSQGRRV